MRFRSVLHTEIEAVGAYEHVSRPYRLLHEEDRVVDLGQSFLDDQLILLAPLDFIVLFNGEKKDYSLDGLGHHLKQLGSVVGSGSGLGRVVGRNRTSSSSPKISTKRALDVSRPAFCDHCS